MACQWPRDNQQELIAFYGTPGTRALEGQLVVVELPFKMYYPLGNGQRKVVTKVTIHKKVAASFTAIMREIWLLYHKSQKELDASGFTEFNGTYNPRKVRGSKTKWSNHAFASAIDVNASNNPLGQQVCQMPSGIVDIFRRYGWRWGGKYRGRKDCMHFEAVCTDSGIALKNTYLESDDNYHDGEDTPEDHLVENDTETYQDLPWYRRAWNWVTGGSILGGTGYGAYSDPVSTGVVVGLVLVFLFLVTWSFIWFLGPSKVRNFIRRRVGI